MSTGVVVVLGILVIIGALKGLYLLTLYYLFEDEVRADEIHMVTTEDGWQICLYRHTPVEGAGTPVLLVHGLSGNQFNFTYPDGESLVDELVRGGYDCWLMDMRGSRSSKGPHGTSRFKADLDGVLMYDLPAAIDFVRTATGYDKIHYIGHSLGGMVFYAYELVHGQDKIATGITLGSPVRVRPSKFPFTRTLLSWIKIAPSIAELQLRVLAPFRPLYKGGGLINWENMHESMGSKSSFNLIELPAPRVLDELKEWGDRGEWRMNGGAVDVIEGLSKLKTPLFLIYGAKDPFISVPEATEFHERLASKDKEMLILSKENGHYADYSHVDLAFSVKGREEVYQPILRWLDRHAISDRLDIPESAELVAAATGQDASWRKALRRAAEVMNSMDGGGERRASKAKPKSRAKAAAKAPKPAPKRKMTTVQKRKAAVKRSAKKSAAKKAASTKTKAAAAKKTSTAKKATAKKSAAKKSAAKKTSAKKSTAKKSAVKKSTVKKSTAKKATAKKAAARKTSTRKKASS